MFLLAHTRNAVKMGVLHRKRPARSCQKTLRKRRIRNVRLLLVRTCLWHHDAALHRKKRTMGELTDVQVPRAVIFGRHTGTGSLPPVTSQGILSDDPAPVHCRKESYWRTQSRFLLRGLLAFAPGSGGSRPQGCRHHRQACRCHSATARWPGRAHFWSIFAKDLLRHW